MLQIVGTIIETLKRQYIMSFYINDQKEPFKKKLTKCLRSPMHKMHSCNSEKWHEIMLYPK